MTALWDVGTVAPATGASGFAAGPQSLSWACWVSRHPDGFCALAAGGADAIGLDSDLATAGRDPAGADSGPTAARDAAHTPVNTSTQVMTNASHTVESRAVASTGHRASMGRER